MLDRQGLHNEVLRLMTDDVIMNTQRDCEVVDFYQQAGFNEQGELGIILTAVCRSNWAPMAQFEFVFDGSLADFIKRREGE